MTAARLITAITGFLMLPPRHSPGLAGTPGSIS